MSFDCTALNASMLRKPLVAKTNRLFFFCGQRDPSTSSLGSGDAFPSVNHFGGAPTIKLISPYHAARKILEKRRLKRSRRLVGSFVTSFKWPAARSPSPC
jgi:hypothetical protein